MMSRLKYIFLPLTLLVGSSAIAGNEYYWRLGAIWEDSQDATFLDRRCEPPSGQVALFGCVDGEDGRPIGARGDFSNSLGIQIAWGMHFGEMWRAELEFVHQPDFEFEGNANFLNAGDTQPVFASVNHVRAGANVFLDLAEVFGYEAGTLKPYVGAGVTAARNRSKRMFFTFPELENQPALTTVPCDSQTNLGWMLTAGTGFELSPRNVIDLGVSWHDHGRLQTSADFIDIIRGGESVAVVEVGATSARLESWGVSLSWRHYLR